jgi:hypothetical protein
MTPEDPVSLTAWREGFPQTERTMMVPRRMAMQIGKWYAESGWLVKIEPELELEHPAPA